MKQENYTFTYVGGDYDIVIVEKNWDMFISRIDNLLDVYRNGYESYCNDYNEIVEDLIEEGFLEEKEEQE